MFLVTALEVGGSRKRYTERVESIYRYDSYFGEFGFYDFRGDCGTKESVEYALDSPLGRQSRRSYVRLRLVKSRRDGGESIRY